MCIDTNVLAPLYLAGKINLLYLLIVLNLKYFYIISNVGELQSVLRHSEEKARVMKKKMGRRKKE